MQDNGFDLLIILLEFKGDQDPIMEGQEGIVKADGELVPNKLKVAQAKTFGKVFALDS